MSGAVLYRVIWPVPDIERAATFYGAVLEDVGERVSPGRHYIACGGTILALYDPVADSDGMGDGWRHHDQQYLYFAVGDLKRTRRLLVEAGGLEVGATGTQPWGERSFYALDPFGSPLCFVDTQTVFRGGGFFA